MNELWIPLLFALVAFLYAMVGHGGASGYLAVMALLSMSDDAMKHTGLVLNICVSLIATVQFFRAGHFRWNLFWPFALASFPCAYYAGNVNLDPLWYKRLLAGCLVLAALRLLGLFSATQRSLREPPIIGMIIIGAVIGALSGMLRIGGGVLLSPVIIMCAWANTKHTAAVAAPFILVNSIAGLLGAGFATNDLSPNMWLWVGAAVIGGVIGSWLGARKAPEPRLRQALALVMLVACIKLIWP
jgi:uncharacterized protein